MLLLFAQAARNQNNNADDGAAAMMVFAVYGGFFLLFFLVEIFFLITLSRTLSQCHPKNRAMEPGMVWLNLVPFLNIVWMFLTVIKVSDSLKREFRYRRLPSQDDYGQTLGIISGALLLTCWCIGIITGIMYWVKIADYKRQLETSAREDDWGDEDDDEEGSRDEEDDRPRKRRKEYDDEDEDDRPR